MREQNRAINTFLNLIINALVNCANFNEGQKLKQR